MYSFLWEDRKDLAPVSCRTEKSSGVLGVGMEECGMRIWRVPLSWPRSYFCPSLPVKRCILPSITFSPNLGQHWARRKLRSLYKAGPLPYCQRNLGDVAQLSTGKQGRPKTLRIIAFMMKNFTWKVRSDKFPNYPSKQLSFLKWSFQWWKWLYFAWLWMEWHLFCDVDLCVALSAILKK